jgi:plasmid stabilization system protein ParE
MALADRDAIMVYIAQDNPTAAMDLDLEFEARAEVMVYRVTGDLVEMLRVLHTAQQWP